MTTRDAATIAARAAALLESGDEDGAIGTLDSALRGSSTPSPVLATNLGRLLWRRGAVDRAIALLERSTVDAPHMAAAWLNFADALAAADDPRATGAYRRSLVLMPEAADIHWTLAAHLMVHGAAARAWPHFHWRRRDSRVRRRPTPFPRIEALDRAPRRMLVWSNEGIGEDLRYASLLPALAAAGVEIVLEADPRLVPLMRRSLPAIETVARAWPPAPAAADPAIGGHATLADLLPLLSDRPLPRAARYLSADAAMAAAARARYRQLGSGPLVGLSWSSRGTPFARSKSVGLADLAPLLGRPATFVSLQYADAGEPMTGLHRDPSIDPLADLDAFAAQVAAMDLVVTSSSTTAHMAGTLGVPVWVMLHRGPPVTPYWRIGQPDVAWYPSMRVWRQGVPGRWSDVIASIGMALDAWLRQPLPAGRP